MQVTVNGVSEIEALLNAMTAEMGDNARKALQKSLFTVKRKTASRLKNGPLYSRTGDLAKSFKYKTNLKGEIKDLYGEVYTDSIYARIHETGGTINAKNKYINVPGGPFLNVPLSANKTPAGVMRENARSVFAGGGYIFKSKKGNWIVMSGNDVPMFVLKKQVTIPARLEFVKTATDEVPTLISNLNKVLLDGLD